MSRRRKASCSRRNTRPIDVGGRGGCERLTRQSLRWPTSAQRRGFRATDATMKWKLIVLGSSMQQRPGPERIPDRCHQPLERGRRPHRQRNVHELHPDPAPSEASRIPARPTLSPEDRHGHGYDESEGLRQGPPPMTPAGAAAAAERFVSEARAEGGRFIQGGAVSGPSNQKGQSPPPLTRLDFSARTLYFVRTAAHSSGTGFTA